MASLFSPPADQWRRLSPKYATVRRIGALVSGIIPWAVIVASVWFALDWRFGLAALVAGVAWITWRVVRAGRWAKAFGFAERGEDLCITRGLWFKDLTVIPYGRLQLVKVEAGPMQRAFGLATVTLVTAAAHSEATVPGLPEADATELRDRLIEIGDALGGGL